MIAWAKEQELPEGPEEGKVRLGLTAWEMMFFEGVQTYFGWAYSLSDRTFTETPSTTGRAEMAKYGILTVFYLNGAVHIFLNESAIFLVQTRLFEAGKKARSSSTP